MKFSDLTKFLVLNFHAKHQIFNGLNTWLLGAVNKLTKNNRSIDNTTMDKKWTIGLGLLGILIVFLLLWNFAPAIQRWLASVFVDIILLLAAFAAGWLFGRFGGKRRRSDDERNARNITQVQKK